MAYGTLKESYDKVVAVMESGRRMLGRYYRVAFYGRVRIYFDRTTNNRRKYGVEERIFDHIALHIECRLNKNPLLRCYLLAFFAISDKDFPSLEEKNNLFL